MTNEKTYNINVYRKLKQKTLCLQTREEVNLQVSSEEIFEKVKNIIVDLLQVSEDAVTEEAHFIDDLGADSLDLVELIMGIEEEFNIEIPDGEAEKVVTVGDVVDYIKENVK